MKRMFKKLTLNNRVNLELAILVVCGVAIVLLAANIL
jgi:uncharacterized protein (UPF0333 family)